MGCVAFQDGVLEIADAGGFSGANHITVKIQKGGLKWSEPSPAQAMKDRGTLDHWRPAEEEPMSWSISGEDHGLVGTSGTSNVATTLREALKGEGSASDWATDDPNSAVYTTQLRLTITDPGDGSGDADVLIENARTEMFEYSEEAEANTFTASGRALSTEPTFS